MKNNEHIRWAILGTGQMANDFAEALARVPDAKLVAVASRSPERSRKLAGKFSSGNNCPQAFDDYDSLLDQKNCFDVIYIATLNNTHAALTLECLRRNIAIVCEKPFAMNAAETERVIKEAESTNVFCMEAMWMRFHPLVRKAVEWIQQGKIGELELMTADFGYPVVENTENRFFSNKLGGGALLDRGVYPISLAVQCLGVPTHVGAALSFTNTDVDGCGSISLQFPNAVANLHYSMLHQTSNTAVFYGTKGAITLEPPFFRPHRLVWNRKQAVPNAVDSLSQATSGPFSQKLRSKMVRWKRWSERFLPPAITRRGHILTHFDDGKGYEHEILEVHRCLRSGLNQSPIMPLEQTLQIMRVIDQVRDLLPR